MGAELSLEVLDLLLQMLDFFLGLGQRGRPQTAVGVAAVAAFKLAVLARAVLVALDALETAPGARAGDLTPFLSGRGYGRHRWRGRHGWQG